MPPSLPFANSPARISKWPDLHGAGVALSIHDWQQSQQKLLVVICAEASMALQLTDELSYLAKDQYSVINFPEWETLPYDQFSPHQDIISDRLKAMNELPRLDQGVLIIPAATLSNRLPPCDYVELRALKLAKGQDLDVAQLRTKLGRSGYQNVEIVRDHGQYAFRGSLIDIFPMGTDEPVRIDLFDNEIETLKFFDVDTQRTTQTVESIELLPAQEVPTDRNHRLAFEEAWHEQFDVDFNSVPMYQDIINGLTTPGIEYFLSLFFDETTSILDYCPADSHLFLVGDISSSLDRHWRDINNRYEQFRGDTQRPILAPHLAFHPVDRSMARIKAFARYQFTIDNRNPIRDLGVTIDGRREQPLEVLKAHLAKQSKPVVISVDSLGRRELLDEQLRKAQIKVELLAHWDDLADHKTPKCYLLASPFYEGSISQNGIQIFTDAELYGLQVRQTRRRNEAVSDDSLIIRDLSQLEMGDPVVHIEHGIGRYRGLENLTIDGEKIEFVVVEYAGESTLYIPVASLHVLSRYSGSDPDSAPLHRLGSETWSNAKQKAAEKARDAAVELLDIYARREAKKGFAFPDPGPALAQFSASFPFEETPDQEKTINAVVADMMAPRAMDRLVGGDVGFGKTEVAMRAAFVAVHAAKQVAVLVPTTLLAQQHYDNFLDRFKDWPVRIEVISRFKSDKAINEINAALSEGKVDILIGTHKLLQSSLKFDDLGLLIIDEEHRFGVRQKERIKSLRAEVDILTMTATPIPRTLNLAMNGMRDLSIIATPPAKRLKINTFVRENDDNLIKEAVLREILRGGQVYFLHNEVTTIERTAEEIQALVPEARIGIGHGQMRERELERVMSDFYHRRTNVLVCTTIIETGIDIPNANTIIIHRADKFGIAQLHQLRGRVGRSHHQAYAYLLTPPYKGLKKDAKKRLDAISTTGELGAGFTLATHDLEIRGAGELLGDQQSGQIHSVGFSLYIDMLEQAVADIKAGRTPSGFEGLQTTGEVDLQMPALIPDDYVGDVNERLVLYKRISNTKTPAELRQLQIELIDRFGLLPQPTKRLFDVNEVRQRCQDIGIKKLVCSSTGGKVVFAENTKVEPLEIVQLVQQQSRIFSLQGANELRFGLPLDDREQRLVWVNDLIDHLSKTTQAS
ncbi:transcription-repair coupling factor [uncultured Umboniibacter sp.]|uniref:transcription-repair coupling factor n=1 Tax=uncultured Umboniibacter sp. TaxID=1798917 RepID=UPI002609757B|nr:transcription-repair coupling factor [uncultured Umboniibacter sp.]